MSKRNPATPRSDSARNILRRDGAGTVRRNGKVVGRIVWHDKGWVITQLPTGAAPRPLGKELTIQAALAILEHAT